MDGKSGANMASDKYRLLVTIQEARNLAAKDLNGKSDPYCVVMVDKVKNKTSVVKSSLNPKWNTDFLFNNLTPPVVLQLRLWDFDLIGRDDFLGQLDINLAKSTEMEEWWPLEGRGKDEAISGELRIKIQFETYAELQQRYAVQRLP